LPCDQETGTEDADEPREPIDVHGESPNRTMVSRPNGDAAAPVARVDDRVSSGASAARNNGERRVFSPGVDRCARTIRPFGQAAPRAVEYPRARGGAMKDRHVNDARGR
jgi:hypothetical protein